MGITIDVSDETMERLRRAAAERGVSVEQLASEAADRAGTDAESPADSRTPRDPEKQWRKFQEWVAQTRRVVAQYVPPGHVIDVSRESIYD